MRLPEEEETYGVAPQAAAITLPWTSPWRVLIIGSTLATIVESTMVTDLAPPQAFSDVSWVKPGRVSWSWWSDMTSPRDYQKVFPFVDLASRLHWEYSLLDAGWQQMANGGDAAELAEYAKARNVGLIAWYNSGGAHNKAEDGPRDLMVDPETRRAEMKRIAALGFRGIKVDFMLSDKQYVIGLYHDILRDAYANRLFVDFHGSTIPRGWQRTYPNLLSMEAVRGSEQYGDSVFQRNAATYNTIYPFTRNVIGSMDYTPMIFGDAPDRLPHLTTNPHELALSVVFESGLQHFVSTPAMIDAQPDYVKEFLTAVPTGSAALEPTADILRRSFRKLTPAEVASLKPLRVRVVTARPGDTVATLAGRMMGTDRKLDLFRLINAMTITSTVRPGQKFKIISE